MLKFTRRTGGKDNSYELPLIVNLRRAHIYTALRVLAEVVEMTGAELSDAFRGRSLFFSPEQLYRELWMLKYELARYEEDEEQENRRGVLRRLSECDDFLLYPRIGKKLTYLSVRAAARYALIGISQTDPPGDGTNVNKVRYWLGDPRPKKVSLEGVPMHSAETDAGAKGDSKSSITSQATNHAPLAAPPGSANRTSDPKLDATIPHDQESASSAIENTQPDAAGAIESTGAQLPLEVPDPTAARDEHRVPGDGREESDGGTIGGGVTPVEDLLGLTREGNTSDAQASPAKPRRRKLLARATSVAAFVCLLALIAHRWREGHEPDSATSTNKIDWSSGPALAERLHLQINCDIEPTKSFAQAIWQKLNQRDNKQSGPASFIYFVTERMKTDGQDELSFKEVHAFARTMKWCDEITFTRPDGRTFEYDSPEYRYATLKEKIRLDELIAKDAEIRSLKNHLAWQLYVKEWIVAKFSVPQEANAFTFTKAVLDQYEQHIDRVKKALAVPDKKEASLQTEESASWFDASQRVSSVQFQLGG